MDRLTFDNFMNGGHSIELKAVPCKMCYEVCDMQESCDKCPIADAFRKLSDYEDSGLTPEEVMNLSCRESEQK